MRVSRHPKNTSPLLLNLIYDLTFSKALNLSSLDSLVIDEADLILSYGHDQDMRSVLSAENAYLPTVFQSFLMSATMTNDVEALKGLVLRNPAVLRLEEDEDEARNLVQYAVRYEVSRAPPDLDGRLFNCPALGASQCANVPITAPRWSIPPVTCPRLEASTYMYLRPSLGGPLSVARFNREW